MLVGISGLPNPVYDLPEHSYAPEEVVMIHPKLADAWIAGGIAQAVRENNSLSAHAPTEPEGGGFNVTGTSGLELKQEIEAAVASGTPKEPPKPTGKPRKSST